MNLVMEKEAALALVQQRIDEGTALEARVTRNSDADGWAAKLEHSLGRIFDEKDWAGKFLHRPAAVAMRNPERNIALAKDAVGKTIARLTSLQEIIAESDNAKEASKREIPVPVTARVFLVHGRDDGTKNQVARFLEKAGLDVVILHERPNRGRTLITKFQEESSDVSFAVVLITPDDVGGLVDADVQPRARQNVVFELGFFIGRLGSDRVCALVSDGVEHPSDYQGVVYVPLDANGGWRTELMRELAAARIPVDFAKAFAS